MADEEAPPPNVVAEAKIEIKAPLNTVWLLMKDNIESPKLYDANVVDSKSLGRERVRC
jgi:hypothetical protein